MTVNLNGKSRISVDVLELTYIIHKLNYVSLYIDNKLKKKQEWFFFTFVYSLNNKSMVKKVCILTLSTRRQEYNSDKKYYTEYAEEYRKYLYGRKKQTFDKNFCSIYRSPAKLTETYIPAKHTTCFLSDMQLSSENLLI